MELLVLFLLIGNSDCLFIHNILKVVYLIENCDYFESILTHNALDCSDKSLTHNALKLAFLIENCSFLLWVSHASIPDFASLNESVGFHISPTSRILVLVCLDYSFSLPVTSLDASMPDLAILIGSLLVSILDASMADLANLVDSFSLPVSSPTVSMLELVSLNDSFVGLLH